MGESGSGGVGPDEAGPAPAESGDGPAEPTPELARFVQGFLDHLTVERGMSPHTVAAYRRDLGRYLSHLATRGVGDPTGIGAEDVTSFAHALQTGGVPAADGNPGVPLARASVARAVVAVRSLHRFGVQEQITVDNPAVAVQPPAGGRRLPKALPLDQVQVLLDGVDTTTVLGLRDAALLELLYGTGARITEVVSLDVDDLSRLVDPEADPRQGLRLLGKGDKERIVPLGSFARRAVSDWLVRGRPVLAGRGSGGSAALLLNSRGGRLSRQSGWQVLRAAAERAGIAADVSPHTLRHSFATHLLDGGADVRVVQELLGHASVTTTQIYTLVTVDQLREVYLGAHPRAR